MAEGEILRFPALQKPTFYTKCNLELRRKVQKKHMRKKKHEKTKKIKFLMPASACTVH